MRSFGIISPQFWTGRTGREIQAAGADAVIVAAYLMTSPHSHMCGLYFLPKQYAVFDTGRTLKQVEKALLQLALLPSGAFSQYDEASQHVWLPEMMHWQVGPLKPKDNRISSIIRWYSMLPASPFLISFYERYKEELPGLEKREAPSKPLQRGTEPLNPLCVCPDPDLDSISSEGGAGETKIRLGEFQNVLLLPDDIADLRTRLTEHFDVLVNELDRYGETHPKEFAKYKNHKAVLLSWHGRKEKTNGKPKDRQERNAENARRLLSRLNSENGSGGECGIERSDPGSLPRTLAKAQS